MKFDIDYIAHNNKLSNVNTYLKIIVAISIMLVTLILDNLLLDFIVFIAMAIGILVIARISFRDYIKFLSIPIIFASMSCLLLLFFFGDGKVIFDTGIFGIVIREDSFYLATSTFCRVFACFSCLGFLTLTTPIAQILHVLGEIKVPKILIEIALLMYTTIFIFLEQLYTMRQAQETRLGYMNTRSAYRSLGYLFSNLFFKSLDKSEVMMNSLNSRGYTGQLPTYKPSKK
ncbi:cobalt ECF transporter T component CbiQ [Methanobrevibacter sp. OttesenSCG-928-K11]|nr:cobalt ECF transporter T component CbiQ [Methanobrevibacter sp. OttesenSCG-928-K11]MDL2270761.1 cobalt ECF transporter T component CbiQ [Methanobrevibacter sp. OttesenSCG-928-I08]